MHFLLDLTPLTPGPSLCGLHWFGVKVPLCVHGGFLLRLVGEAGVHVVWWDGAGDGTETRHGDLEDLGVKLLHLHKKNKK